MKNVKKKSCVELVYLGFPKTCRDSLDPKPTLLKLNAWNLWYAAGLSLTACRAISSF